MTSSLTLNKIIAISAGLVAAFLSTIMCTEPYLKIIRTDTFGALEDFYLKVKMMNDIISYPGLPEDVSAEVKNTICLNVLSSGFFNMHNKEAMNMKIPEEVDRLGAHDPDLADQLSLVKTRESHTDVNPAVPIKIILGMEFHPGNKSADDSVFRCPLWDRDAGTFENVYLSKAYELENGIDARFLFVSRNRNMVLMAVAEEPAYDVWNTENWPSRFELDYIEARRESKPARTEKEDPVCQHNIKKRIEICSSILSSLYYADKFIFYPNPLSTTETCKIYKIGFRIEGTDVPNHYEDWMLLCDAIEIKKESTAGEPEIDGSKNEIRHKQFFISRAYNGNPTRTHVFTLDIEDNLMYLENVLFSSVLNIGE